MDSDKRLFAALAVTATLVMPAFAQAPPKAAPPTAPKAEPLNSTVCAPSDTPSTVGKGAQTDTQTPAGSNLSDKLARSNGVICPPSNLDHEIRAPTPPGGTMPVIPPPGAPGGDRSVQPK